MTHVIIFYSKGFMVIDELVLFTVTVDRPLPVVFHFNMMGGFIFGFLVLIFLNPKGFKILR